ncbi:MAG: NAD(+)/NADH kinase [Anaerolineae bacterium]|nr:NAD(+)/NADH kinase [Anaerolineae bacterium]
MSTVGIIANPASGKDIRRLVTHASVFDNHEKAHILKRALLALDAVRVRRVLYMPDYYGLVERALDDLHLSLEATELRMNMWADDRDSTEAAKRFCEEGVGCIITLGGDGTNRAVAKGCGDVPLVAISTGTNNVFPCMLESTVAGLAAGLVSERLVDLESVSYTAKRLDVYVDGELTEIALVDVVASTDLFIGSRALWDPRRIREMVLARAEPDSLGMSSIGGVLRPIGPLDPHGMHIRLGAGDGRVIAPIGPGLIIPIDIEDHRLLSIGDEVALERAACTVAVDGERQIEVFEEQQVTVRLVDHGPCVVDVQRCIYEASERGVLHDPGLLFKDGTESQASADKVP